MSCRKKSKQRSKSVVAVEAAAATNESLRYVRLVDEAKNLMARPSTEYNEGNVWFLKNVYQDLRSAYQQATDSDMTAVISQTMTEVADKVCHYSILKQAASQPSATSPNAATVPQSNSTHQRGGPFANPPPSNSDCLSFKQVTFDGSPLEFKHHLLQVEGLISRSQWSDVMKFQYLRNTLPTEVRRVIAHIDPEKPVLTDAITALKKYFVSDDKIKEDIIKRVLKLPKVHEESSMSIWNEYVEVIEFVRLNKDSYDDKTLENVVTHLSRKLPYHEYNELLLTPGVVTIDVLKTFVEPRRARAKKLADQLSEFETQKHFYDATELLEPPEEGDPLKPPSNVIGRTTKPEPTSGDSVGKLEPIRMARPSNIGAKDGFPCDPGGHVLTRDR